MSLTSETEETVKYKVNTLQDVKYKLTLISLPNNWLVWYRDNLTTFILPSLIEQNISVDLLKLIVSIRKCFYEWTKYFYYFQYNN